MVFKITAQLIRLLLIYYSYSRREIVNLKQASLQDIKINMLLFNSLEIYISVSEFKKREAKIIP